jgi:hypothetical protein
MHTDTGDLVWGDFRFEKSEQPYRQEPEQTFEPDSQGRPEIVAFNRGRAPVGFPGCHRPSNRFICCVLQPILRYRMETTWNEIDGKL